jgi:hypothetical protein
MKKPILKKIGKGLLSFTYTFAIIFLILYWSNIHRLATTGSWNAPPPVVDPSLCYSGHGILIYDHDRFRPPDKCPSKRPQLQPERSE